MKTSLVRRPQGDLFDIHEATKKTPDPFLSGWFVGFGEKVDNNSAWNPENPRAVDYGNFGKVEETEKSLQRTRFENFHDKPRFLGKGKLVISARQAIGLSRLKEPSKALTNNSPGSLCNICERLIWPSSTIS